MVNKAFTSIDFSNSTSKWIIEKYELIIEHLNKMLSKSVLVNKSKTTLIQQNLLYTKQVLSVLGSERCANTLIYFFLDLVSKETKVERLIQIDCFTWLGKKLVNIYIYNLYKEYCKINGVNISLSEWKNLDENQNHNHLYESQIIVAIAGNLVQFLTTASVNMIELTTEYADDKKLHNTIRIQEDARNIILKSENTKIFSVPAKLPMIVEPKQYKLVNNKIILGKKALSIESRQMSNTHSLKSKDIDNIALIGPTRPHDSGGLPIQSSPNGYMAAVCGLQLQAFRPVEDVDTFESIRSLYRASHLPSVPIHEPLPSVPMHEPGLLLVPEPALPSVPIHETSIPGSPGEVSTTNIDLLAVSKEFAVKSDLIKRKLIKNKWARDKVEAIESDKTSVTESSDLSASGLENFFSYLTDSSEKYLSLLNDFVSNNQLAMLAIITLASLVTIFTFLFKLVKTLAKFVKFMFKSISISKTISRGIHKRNKKTNSSLMKTLLKVYFISFQISKALSSPNSNRNEQGHPEIRWASPEHVSNTHFNQRGYSEIRWAGTRCVSADGEFIINSSQTTSNQDTSNAESSHTIPTSNTQIYTAQTNVNPAILGSMEWRAFCMESLHLLATDMYPIHIKSKDTITTANKLLSSLENHFNHDKSIGEVFSKKDLQDLFKQFPIKQSESMYSEPGFLEFAVHALHVLATSLTFNDDKNLLYSLWIEGPDRDSQPDEINSSEEFFGWGREVYNLKLIIEQALHIEHKIRTTNYGNYPDTVFRANDICGVSLKDLKNSDFMRAILRDHPQILRKFYKFLHQVSDTDFVPYMLKSSGGDALRMINILLVTAESVRIGHNRRCHYYVKVKEFLDKLGIDTRATAPISAYHVKNRNNKVENKVFTWARGVNMNYKELRCYLSNEQKNIYNEKLRHNTNTGNRTQHINPTKLGEVHISEHYDMLLNKFFNKNRHFLSPASLTSTVSYHTVSINVELLKAIDEFSLSRNSP